MRQRTGLWPVLFLCVGFFSLTQAGEMISARPAISIVIDDMGRHLEDGRRVLALPGPVACAFLPGARHTDYLARQANGVGKEVLLHLPMESADGRRLDAGAVTLDMTKRQFVSTVEADLDSVPYAVGINNHMGSLLTRHPGHMLWLMRVMQRQAPLFFVDSRTTVNTVAKRIALENDVPNIERNVFLDNKLGADEIDFQFERLVRLAKKQGTALAIGHPHPQTLELLEQRIPQLRGRGIQLLPVRNLIDIQQPGENKWQASWSPSRRDVKN